MNTELDIDKNNILIFHTHTCESYTPSETYPYEQTGNFRTTDLNYTVARLGDELTNYLLGFGFKVTKHIMIILHIQAHILGHWKV